MQKGFTLVELLCCLAIAGVLVGYGIPGLNHMLARSQAASAINWILGQVMYARSAAISFNTTVTLCPSSDGERCGGHWDDGTITFTDHNQDHEPNGNDELLRHVSFPIEDANLTWHAFQNRQYLQMLGTGYTNYQNGNFVYCPPDNDPRFARQLVINIQGRGRTSKDINHDGYVEDRLGHHLECP